MHKITAIIRSIIRNFWWWLITLGVLLLVLLFVYTASTVYPFGPRSTVTTTVTRAYIDVSGSKESGTHSHYLVVTDDGVFEVDNSIVLSIYNADELFGRIKEGRKYTFTVKGERIVNAIWQLYPGIIAVKEEK